jgi:hypothetical protein
MRQYYASDRKKREEAKRRKREEKRIKRLSRNASKATEGQSTPVAEPAVATTGELRTNDEA